MNEIVLCKYCNNPEYYGKMMWLSGRCMCRSCYKNDYEQQNGEPYSWDDLNGYVPTLKDYAEQHAKNQDSFTMHYTDHHIYKIYDNRGMHDHSGIQDSHNKTVYIFNTSICIGAYSNMKEALDGINRYEEINYESK